MTICIMRLMTEQHCLQDQLLVMVENNYFKFWEDFCCLWRTLCFFCQWYFDAKGCFQNRRSWTTNCALYLPLSNVQTLSDVQADKIKCFWWSFSIWRSTMCHGDFVNVYSKVAAEMKWVLPKCFCCKLKLCQHIPSLLFWLCEILHCLENVWAKKTFG